MRNMTATVIHLPTERMARRGPEASRRRHPAGGRGPATVVPLQSVRFQRRVLVEAHLDAMANPCPGPDWVTDAHAAIDGFTQLIDLGRADDLVDLCTRALAHLRAAAPEIDDPDALTDLTDHLEWLRGEARRAPRPG